MTANDPSATSTELDALCSIRDWMRYFVSEMNRTKVFYGHGNATAVDEAVYLVQSALSLPISDISPYLDATVTSREKQTLARYLALRTIDRLPAPYITGNAWLVGHEFDVDERVIVPRSFLAELLEHQLSPWVQDPDAPLQVLDLCCGSACLGILAALALPQASVDCVDLSPDALDVARGNVQKHQLESRVNLIQSDLFQALDGKTYDVILTNPPYVNASSMKELPAEYRHEPTMALAGGDDGMDLIETILVQSAGHLQSNGLLFCELGNEREHFEAKYPYMPALWLEVSAGEDQVFMMHKRDYPSPNAQAD